jgi:hypothetical protein
MTDVVGTVLAVVIAWNIGLFFLDIGLVFLSLIVWIHGKVRRP